MMIRKFMTLGLLASTVIAAPAMAQDVEQEPTVSKKGTYFGVYGGIWHLEKTRLPLSSRTLDHNEGVDFGALYGKDLGRLRFETELGYKSSSLESLTVNTPANVVGVQEIDADGRLRAYSLFSNLLFDLGSGDTSLQFGGGFGSIFTKMSARADYAPLNYSVDFTDKARASAYQVIVAAEKALTSNVHAGLRYRYMRSGNLDFTTNSGATWSGRLHSSSVLGTVTYYKPVKADVGEIVENVVVDEAVLEDVIKECADGSIILIEDSCAPDVVVETGPFMVFFDWDESDITSEAAATLDEAAAAYLAGGQANIMLAGHADRSGADAYNVDLSQRRADAVAAYLAAKGVPADAMNTGAYGESDTLVPTEDGVREPQNRRVEISFGPGSGQ